MTVRRRGEKREVSVYSQLSYFESVFTKMDSAEDAYKQSRPGSSNLLCDNGDDFCSQPFCLGKRWHE